MTRPIQSGDLVAGKYRVDRVLGEGGMGIVVAATHEELDQRVALKFLLPDLVSNVEVVQRFMREARAAVKIHSEHVARVLDVGKTETGTPYMVMEYLDGEDLSQVVARRPLAVDEAVGFVLEACEAIAEAHSLGIVHRDLKPANLFLARRPSGKPAVKVLDFGISKVPATTKDAVTSTNALMGSPIYMSPEQMVAPNTVDVRTDVWCLGVVLYELLTQSVPFAGETMPELVFTVVQKPHIPLLSVRPDVPGGLVAVIDRCLEKAQAERFSGVAELARALLPFAPPRSEQSVERIEHVLGAVTAPPFVPAPRTPLVSRPEGQTFLPTTSQPAVPRRGIWLVPAVLVLGMAATGAFFAFRPARRAAGEPAPATTTAPTVVPSVPVSAIAPASAVALAPPRDDGASTTASAPPTVTAPWWAGKPGPRPPASARASASPSAAAVPTCHVISFFDAEGNKHFKQECP